MDSKYMDVVQYFAEHRSEYYLSVYFPVALWLLVTLVFIIVLFKKYTFGDWTEEHPNPHSGETFDMPRGTFRGILTMTLLYVTVIFELANVRIIGLEEELHEFIVAFQMMIAFYFGSKVMHHVTSADRSKAEYVSESEQTSGSTQQSFTDESAAG